MKNKDEIKKVSIKILYYDDKNLSIQVHNLEQAIDILKLIKGELRVENFKT